MTEKLTTRLSSLMKTRGADLRAVRAGTTIHEAAPEILARIRERAQTYEELGEGNAWDEKWGPPEGVEDSYEGRLVRWAFSGEHPELTQFVTRIGDAVYNYVGAGPEQIKRGAARTAVLANELEGAIDRYAPHLRAEMDTTVRRAVEEYGPLGAFGVAAAEDVEGFADDVIAGRVSHDIANPVFQMNPPSDAGFVEPQAPAGFDAASAPLDDVRAAIQEDALDRLGRGPAGPYDALTNDDLQSLINRRD